MGAINEIREWAEKLPSGEISISDQANEMFSKYYETYYRRCQNEGLIPTLIVRIQDFIFKIALLYAAIDKSTVIERMHIATAIEVGNYLESSVTSIFQSFEDSRLRLKDDQLLKFLRDAGNL